ncbi:hypothetical protein WN48_10734 [Eufriesea mexicana]|uniref:Uncharacterized protein n=1 Tax=Eufriesea mexicana TaxID=516756 RepID=A0A310SHV0_9HYME|nr:hypothetical protein WN48_10734 [Eufriesea mexicana]
MLCQLSENASSYHQKEERQGSEIKPLFDSWQRISYVIHVRLVAGSAMCLISVCNRVFRVTDTTMEGGGEEDRGEMKKGKGKAEQGWGDEAAGGMGSYEGEVIQLLSNLGATLLGGEPLGALTMLTLRMEKGPMDKDGKKIPFRVMTTFCLGQRFTRMPGKFASA